MAASTDGILHFFINFSSKGYKSANLLGGKKKKGFQGDPSQHIQFALATAAREKPANSVKGEEILKMKRKPQGPLQPAI